MLIDLCSQARYYDPDHILLSQAIDSISLNGNGLLDQLQQRLIFFYLLDEVTASDNKTRISRSMAELGPARGQMNKGKHLGFSRSKQSKKVVESNF